MSSSGDSAACPDESLSWESLTTRLDVVTMSEDDSQLHDYHDDCDNMQLTPAGAFTSCSHEPSLARPARSSCDIIRRWCDVGYAPVPYGKVTVFIMIGFPTARDLVQGT